MGNADSEARNAYNGATAFPTLTWNGTIRMVGAGTDVINGEPYRVIINNLLDEPSYFKITVNSVDLSAPTGSINLDIEVMEDVPSIASTYLRMSLTEDNVLYGSTRYYNVNRDMLADTPITVDGFGEVQHVQMNFAIDPSWIEANLEIVAFIQRDSDKQVLQSTSTAAMGDQYSLRYYALGERAALGPIYGLYSFDFFRLYNFGTQTDNFHIVLTMDSPSDWVGNLCDDMMCYGTSVDQTLAPGEYIELYPDIVPLSSGYAHITVTFTQDGQPGVQRKLQYMYFTNDLDVLAVDDDGAETYEDYFTDALGFYNERYGVWDRSIAAPDAAMLANFNIVVWWTGLQYPTLDDDDRAALGTFMDNGGGLFVTGQEIGWELEDAGGAAYTWYQNYLHATFVNDDANDYTLSGVAGDPVSDDLALVIQGGDGANNQDYPDVIQAGDGTATNIYFYDANRKGAIRSDDGTNRVVYLGFGYEAIDNATDRRALLRRAIYWLRTGSSDVEGEQNPTFRLALSAWPNPVRAEAQVRFTLPAEGEAVLSVFGPDGRVVRTLASGPLAAGNHVLAWDRRTDGGQPVPAGVYYYRLVSGDQTLSHKTVVLR